VAFLFARLHGCAPDLYSLFPPGMPRAAISGDQAGSSTPTVSLSTIPRRRRVAAVRISGNMGGQSSEFCRSFSLAAVGATAAGTRRKANFAEYPASGGSGALTSDEASAAGRPDPQRVPESAGRRDVQVGRRGPTVGPRQWDSALRNIDSRLGSQPHARARACPMRSATRACNSTSTGRVPSIHGDTAVPGLPRSRSDRNSSEGWALRASQTRSSRTRRFSAVGRTGFSRAQK